MPHREGDDERNIVLNEMNEPFTQYALSDEALARWDKLIALRDDVNGVLESARASKLHRQAAGGFRPAPRQGRGQP